MALIGFAATNPIAVMTMIDNARWRVVPYAETPRSIAAYRRFISEEKADNRKVALVLLGAINLPRVFKDRARFSSILVFDVVENVVNLASQIEGFQIIDLDKDGNGIDYRKQLTPVELMEVIERPGSLPDPFPLLAKITNALGKRRPTVLETTSRLPVPEAVKESGCQRRFAELKEALPDDTKVPFSLVLDTYVKYLFRIVDRNFVTTHVTKKLPSTTKDLWKELLDVADSDIGKAMSLAYRQLCVAVDADYRISHAVAEFGLRPYSGDFVYFTAILPPHKNCEFLPGIFDEMDKPSLPLVKTFKPPLPKAAAKQRGKKKARNEG